MDVGKRLKEIRQSKNISIYRLSLNSGVSESHIRNIENGEKSVTVDTLQLLTASLHIALPEFFNEDEQAIYLTCEEKLLLKYFRALPNETENAVLAFCEKLYKQSANA